LSAIATTVKPIMKHFGEYNAYGYIMIGQHRYKEAINVFKINTIIFPTYAGAYDSLADGYLNAGDNANAKKYYQKVLELKPDDKNTKEMLNKIP